MTFHRERQVFVSSLGSVIDQTRTFSGAGFEALSFREGEIQKRSYPNSFGGQHQLKGYELIQELALLEPRAARCRRGCGAALRRPVPRRPFRSDPG